MLSAMDGKLSLEWIKSIYSHVPAQTRGNGLFESGFKDKIRQSTSNCLDRWIHEIDQGQYDHQNRLDKSSNRFCG